MSTPRCPAPPPIERHPTVIVLGIILIVLGYLLPVPSIIVTIGWILLVIGLILTLLGAVLRARPGAVRGSGGLRGPAPAGLSRPACASWRRRRRSSW